MTPMRDTDVTENPPSAGVLEPGAAFFGKFEILAKLGEGGMSVVYKARQLDMERVVALKVLHVRMLEDSKSYKRFRREAQAISALDHPNIVRMLFLQTDASPPFMAMEYIDGGSLADFIREHGKISPEEAVSIVAQAARGLAHAHELGILHRDIKPANIMLKGAAKQVQVVDFGVAQLLGTQHGIEQKLTQTNALIGTPYYMSPEQCENKPLDVRSDVYSLGCVLYEMLAGHVPFSGDSPLAVMFGHIHEKPAELENVPASLRAICMRMLEKSPERRFATMGEVVEELGQPAVCRIAPHVVARVPLALRQILMLGLLLIVLAALFAIVKFTSHYTREEASIDTASEAYDVAEQSRTRWLASHDASELQNAQKMYRKSAELAMHLSDWQFEAKALWRSAITSGNPDGQYAADDALELFRTSAAKEMGDPELLQLGLRRFEEYERMFRRVPFGDAPYRRLRFNWLAQISRDYEAQHKRQKAVEWVKKWREFAIALNDSEEFVAASSYLSKIQPAESLQITESALKEMARHERTNTAEYAVLKAQQGDTLLAAGRDMEAKKAWQQALAILLKSKRVGDKPAAVLLCGKLRGLAWRAPADKAEAVRLTRIAVKLQDELLAEKQDVSPADRIGNIHILAYSLLESGDYAEALRTLESAFVDLKRLNPNDVLLPVTYHYKGKILTALKRPDDADRSYAKAQDLIERHKNFGPMSVALLSDRASAAALNKKFDLAIEVMREEKRIMGKLIAQHDRTYTKSQYDLCDIRIAEWTQMAARAKNAI